MDVRAIRKRLEARADPEVKRWGERYFKGAIEFIGVKRAGVDAVLREIVPELKAHDDHEVIALGLELVCTPTMETRQLGIELLAKKKRALPDTFVATLVPVFERHVADWATCDGLAGKLLREMVKRPKVTGEVVAWSKAKHPWRQRASAVAFVNEAKHGAFDDQIIAVCTRIVKNPDRFVQLGCGWVLRELSLHDRPRVLAFIDAHARELSREGLRYATEKLPKALRAEIHDRHAARSRA